MGDAHITLQGIGVSLGGNPILRAVDLEVGSGDILGVSGPNGSGKTTLLRLIATLIKPDAGNGQVLGARLGTGEVAAVRTRIGMVTHTPALISELTLRENLEHAVRLIGGDVGRVEGALRVVGLERAANRMAAASSFGMQRRIEVARLLITMPRLLLLDEAISGLDSDAASLVDALIERSISSDGSVVMVSHDEAHLADRCRRVLTLTDGHLVTS
ncbi:MAG: ABC transporter ATP-binding protein [Acidimicrobiia bacterium]